MPGPRADPDRTWDSTWRYRSCFDASLYGGDQLQHKTIEKVLIRSPNRSHYCERADHCVGMIWRELGGVCFDHDLETRPVRLLRSPKRSDRLRCSIGVGLFDFNIAASKVRGCPTHLNASYYTRHNRYRARKNPELLWVPANITCN